MDGIVLRHGTDQCPSTPTDLNVTHPLSFLAHQLAGPAFPTMLDELGFPQNLALDLFHHAPQLVAEALDESADQMVQTTRVGALELTGPVG